MARRSVRCRWSPASEVRRARFGVAGAEGAKVSGTTNQRDSAVRVRVAGPRRGWCRAGGACLGVVEKGKRGVELQGGGAAAGRSGRGAFPIFMSLGQHHNRPDARTRREMHVRAMRAGRGQAGGVEW